jgi:WD40 repeat protein
LDWNVTDDFILTCSLDHTMRVWDIKKKKCMHVYDHEAPILCCSFHPVNNNTVAVSCKKNLPGQF